VDSIPSALEEEPVLILADTVEIRFEPGRDGNRVRHRQATWYYVNRRNPNVLEQMVVPDFRSIETAPAIKAQAFYPDGRSWSATALDIVRRNHAEEPLHSSDRFLSVFRFPRYVQGMLIRVEVARSYSRPEFLKSEILRTGLPALSKVVSLALPAGSAIKHAFVNPEGLAVDTVREQPGEEQVLTVRAGYLKKLEAESMPRDPEAWYAALHFSLPARGDRSLAWAELADTYLAAVGGALSSTPELEALAAALPRGPQDSIVLAAYSLVRRRIRYHADLEILHSFVPRPAGTVLAKGYGDCKEMSALLVQILRLRGLRAGLALVSTPGALQVVEAFPSLGGFNHMIVHVRGPGGEIRFLDPTVKSGHPADSYYPLIDRTALVLEDGASALAKVPRGPDYRNRVETRNAIRRSTDGEGWDISGRIRMEGHCAFRMLPALNEAKGEEKGPLLKAMLKELFAVDASKARLAAATDRILEVEYEASFNIHYLRMDRGGLLMAWPSLYGGDVRYTSLDREGPAHTSRFEQSDDWEIPPGFDELEREDLDHAMGRGRWSRRGGRIQRTFSTEETEVPADGRGRLTEYMQARQRFSRASIWRK
jgi:hypothetical protein